MRPLRRTSRATLRRAAVSLALALAGVAGGCERAQRKGPASGAGSTTSTGSAAAPVRGRMPMGGMGGMMGRAAPPADASASTEPAAPLDCGEPNAGRVARGRSVYAGATCTSCHGPDAHGTGLAPNLTDGTWLDADGSYASIAATIRAGVARPRQFPAPMPPAGGAGLTAQQICDVAAYVFSLSH